jgi:hypothetical protein
MMSQEEIEQVAHRMGLEKALREYPQTLERAASRLNDYSASLPAGWTPITDPA